MSIDRIGGKQTVLVVAAHPDDEVLGAGATIARHARSGDAVHILIVAEGLTSRDAKRDAGRRVVELTGLRAAAEKSAKILGAKSITLLPFPDNRLDSVDLLDIVKAVEARVSSLKPSVVYTHHGGDLNVDHRLVGEAVMTACRPQPGHSVRDIFSFEVMSSTHWAGSDPKHAFNPSRFVDVSKTIEKKLSALRAYAGEMRPWPHARSYEAIRALAAFRGATVGVAAAEAFSVLRSLA